MMVILKKGSIFVALWVLQKITCEAVTLNNTHTLKLYKLS